MKLDQFIKWQGIASTGGEAKHLIQSGQVLVNGLVETRRGRQMNPGDSVRFASQELVVTDNDQGHLSCP